jgi:hypothetical protein
MINIASIRDAFKKIQVNWMTLSILLLAGAIFCFALALFSFTHEISMVRREMPRAMDRIDRQISAVSQLAGSAEVTGQKFSKGINKDISSGINKGMSEGLVDLPLNTVANVGYKVSDTVTSTGKQTIGFWQVARDKLFPWLKKPSPTAEVQRK